MELLPLGPKQQGEEAVIIAQTQKRCHLEDPLSELRPADERDCPAGSPSGRELRNTHCYSSISAPFWPHTGTRGPVGWPIQPPSARAKWTRAKRGSEGANLQYSHKEGELFLPSEYKEKQRKWASIDGVVLDSKHCEIRFT